MNMPCRSNKILILIPAYNAVDTLDKLIGRIRKLYGTYNILVVDDGSTDDTLKLLDNLNVGYLSHTPNRGKGYALKRGFDYAVENGYDYVVTIDADLQHLPEELPGIISSGLNSDICIGTRTIDLKKIPPHRWLTNNATSIIISFFCGTRVRDSQSGYRMMKVDLLKMLKTSSVKYDYESEVLFQAGQLGAVINEVTISTVYEGSRSYFKPLADIGRFIKQIWNRIWM